MTQKKVIVGLSGGVDSSIAAWILKERGYLVEGFFMKNWQDDENCPATQDFIDTMHVCDKLDIHLHAENFSVEYKQRVFQQFLIEYKKGRTPNPDVLCNREIKFDVLLNRANELGADYIATGHYAKILFNQQEYQLLAATDKNKDQTYFLYALNQKQLQQSQFPLADWLKTDVRKQAEKLNLITHNKKDSTGICFIGEKNFQQFMTQYLPSKKGNIVDENNKLMGEHYGAAFYTIGQRQGLGIGGQKNGIQKPWYVQHKNTNTNQLTVVQGSDHPLINHQYLQADELHWISSKPPSEQRLTARIRHGQPLQKLQVIEQNKDSITVKFTKHQFAIAVGQSIVFYYQGLCLGGAIINDRW